VKSACVATAANRLKHDFARRVILLRMEKFNGVAKGTPRVARRQALWSVTFNMEEAVPIPAIEKRQIVFSLGGKKVVFDLQHWARMHVLDVKDFGNVVGIKIKIPQVCNVYEASKAYICSSFLVGYRKCDITVEQCREKKLPLPYRPPWYMWQDVYVAITFGVYPGMDIRQYSPKYVEKDLGHLRNIISSEKGKVEIWKLELRSLREAIRDKSITGFNVFHTKWGKLYRKGEQVTTDADEVKSSIVSDLAKWGYGEVPQALEYLFS